MTAKPNLRPLFFILFLTHLTFSSAHSQEEPVKDNTADQTQQEANQTPEQTENPPEKTLPNPETQRIRDLKAQYPKNELKKLQSEYGEFTALWRPDRSGKAFGAVLIVPTDGQTANWPNTIDVLRTELPKSGWSTLSIDIETQAQPKAPPRSIAEPKQKGGEEQAANPQAAPPNSTKQPPTVAHDTNIQRIESAIEFLHNEGQFNIILVGYGISAKRILNYATKTDAAGMTRNMRPKTNNKMQRPVRAMVFVNASGEQATPVAALIESFPFPDMPILDLIIGKHYLDRLDADARKQNARIAGYETYAQLELLEPSNMIFGSENRLSRRVRGFLNKYAKGVEIDNN